MDYSINIKPLSEFYIFDDRDEDKVMSIEERHGSKLNNTECDEDDYETTGEGVGLVFQYDPVSQNMSGKDNKDIAAKHSKQLLHSQFVGEYASARDLTHRDVEMIQRAQRAGVSTPLVNDFRPEGHGKHISEHDASFPLSFAIAPVTEDHHPVSERDETSAKQGSVQAISGHERATIKNIFSVETSAPGRNDPKVADWTPAEQARTHGESADAEMTWHFRSWGNSEKHKARLVFTDLESPDSKVKIIPSDETVRNALIKHQQSDMLPDVRMEFAVSDEKEREGENRESYPCEDEEGQA